MSYQKLILAMMILGLVGCGGVNKKKAPIGTGDPDVKPPGIEDPSGTGNTEGESLSALHGEYGFTIRGVEVTCADEAAKAAYDALLNQAISVTLSSNAASISLVSGEAVNLTGTVSDDPHIGQFSLSGRFSMGTISGDVTGILALAIKTKTGTATLDASQTQTADGKSCETASLEIAIAQGHTGSQLTISYADENGGISKAYTAGEASPIRITKMDDDEGGRYADVQAKIKLLSGRVITDTATGCTVEEDAEHASNQTPLRIDCDTQSDRKLTIQTSVPSK